MPQRKSVKKHNSTAVQGKDSFVEVVQVKVGRIKEMRKAGVQEDGDTFELGLDLLAEHIVNWNWVDDFGEPLPLPRDNPEILDELTEEEATYLVQLLIGSEKN